MSDGWIFSKHSFFPFVSYFIISSYLFDLIIDTTSCIPGRFWKSNSPTHLFTAYQNITSFPYLLSFLLAHSWLQKLWHSCLAVSCSFSVFGSGIWHHRSSSWILIHPAIAGEGISIHMILRTYIYNISHTHRTIITIIPRENGKGANRRRATEDRD